MIEFISHEEFPDDPYIKEVAYLCINSGFHYGYIRKQMKNGSLFWAPMGCAVNKNGEKKFFSGIEVDSNFMKKDILAFLDNRPWEDKVSQNSLGVVGMMAKNYVVSGSSPPPFPIPNFVSTTPTQQSYPEQQSFLDECPF